MAPYTNVHVVHTYLGLVVAAREAGGTRATERWT